MAKLSSIQKNLFRQKLIKKYKSKEILLNLKLKIKIFLWKKEFLIKIN